MVLCIGLTGIDRRGGLGGQLAADCRDVCKTAFAGALIEPELKWQFGDWQQRELLGVDLLGLTLCHSGIIAKGCYKVAW